jgi:hypothetical protein
MNRTQFIPTIAGLIVIALMLTIPGLPATSTVARAQVATQIVGTAQATDPTRVQALKQLETSLLVPTDQCTTPCFWTFQVGTHTVSDFKQVTTAAFGSLVPQETAPEQIMRGAAVEGLALHATTTGTPSLTTVVDAVYVRLNPTRAQAASVNVNQFGSAAIITKYGAPTDAYLLFNSSKPRVYRLVLLYATRSMVYIVRGDFQSGKACLTLDGVDSLTLFRFANQAAAETFVKNTAGTKGAMPASISTTVNKNASDLVQMAQNPTTNCLSVSQ